MRIPICVVAIAAVVFAAAAPAQRIAIGIAPVYDAGGDDFGAAVVQHLTLFTYEDLVGSKQFAPSLLSPGGVYSPLDLSWLSEYVQDRPDLDLLLVATLKPTTNPDKGSTAVPVELILLDAHTGDTKSTWTVSETLKAKNAWLDKGAAMVSSALNNRSEQYGYSIIPSHDFEKQPIGKITAQLASDIRDTLPAHLAGFVKTSAEKSPEAPTSSEPCPMHTRITYGYRHSASHSYTLLANGLDQTTTIVDGVSTFNVAGGPLLLQFTLQDPPYKLSGEPVYQLSTIHSCKDSTLVIDIGQGGDAHHHWE